MLKLIKPTAKYKNSFIAATEEFQRGKKKYVNIKKLKQNFPAFLRAMRDYEKGNHIPKGWVPAHYYWLIDTHGYIGETTIRPRLNTALLKKGGHIGYGIRPTKRNLGYGAKILMLALQKAKKLGIKKALVTCDDDNIGSQKIIESSGGILKNKIRYKGKLNRRYWIKIK